MNQKNFFDVDKNPNICLNDLSSSSYESGVLINCEVNPSQETCCSYYEEKNGLTKEVTKITSLYEYEKYEKEVIDNWETECGFLVKRFENVCTPAKQSNHFQKPEELKKQLSKIIGLMDSVDVNHRLLTKQYNELIFSPNEVINVDENINKFRYLELDRKLEKYDKKTYALYKNFFYIMLITSGILFVRKQLKK
jgi:hypothetical protein